MLDENQLTVIDENGNELLCEIYSHLIQMIIINHMLFITQRVLNMKTKMEMWIYTFLLTFQAITMKVENYFQLKQMLSGI